MNDPEVYVYNTIKKESNLSDANLKDLGITIPILNKAVASLKAAGKSDTQAAESLLSIWRTQDFKQTASVNDMILMGFILSRETWEHQSGIQVTEDERKVLSLSTIENMVLVAKEIKI